MRTLVPLLTVALAGCATPQAATAPVTPPPEAAPVAQATPDAGPQVEDPWLWLEDIDGERALTWVRARNAVSQKELEAAPGFRTLEARLRAILDSKDRVPLPEVRGKWVYNLWRDERNPRGLWRRTTLAEFKKPAPAWETVLDVDALGAAEQKSWVFQGVDCLPPKHERCLVSLSLGGADAAEVREFDTVKKAFVEKGFFVPAAKSQVGWKDQDTLFVATDFGPGSLTKAGYPRVAKEWKRGTPLADAKPLFEADETDLMAAAWRNHDKLGSTDWIERRSSFFSSEVWQREGETLVKMDKPDDVELSVWHDQVLLKLRSDWVINEKIYSAGSLLLSSLKDFKAGKRDFTVLFEPTEKTSLTDTTPLRSALVLTTLEDVKSVVTVFTRGKKGWEGKRLDASPISTAWVLAYDDQENDDFWFFEEDFLTPSTLALGSVGKGRPAVLKRSPSFFSATGLEVTQHFATSKDSTRVPYFEVRRAGQPLDGSAPTLLEAYGGFEVSNTPAYDATVGAAWLERGGVYVLANIRGGGEYGPDWHRAALTVNRQRAFDDFAAVAEDLIARKVTTPKKLGIIGASNGGLLVGVQLTQRPELYGAVVCMVPLLDMKRYHLLLAGASWMEEYGDPQQPDDWAALARYSPYQNVKPGAAYPRTLFLSSTRDDRVHPGHARKMVARLLEQGADLLYYENIEGGHAGAADNAQRAYRNALAYTFLARQLGLP